MAELKNSNYFIDLSKKGILSHSETLTEGNINGSIAEHTAKADLDVSFLKSFELSYKEHFDEYATVLNQKFNELTKVIQDTINAIFSKNLKISAGDLRGKLLEAQLLLTYFNSKKNAKDNENNTNTDTPNTAEGAQEAARRNNAATRNLTSKADIYEELSSIVAQYQMISKYRIPSRKRMPGISVGNSNVKLTFTFAFGKCNLFDAKSEVWDPMHLLYNNLIYLNLGEGDIKGQLRPDKSVKGGAGYIPYNSYAFIDVLASIKKLNDGGKVNTFNINETVQNLMDAKNTINSLNGDADRLEAFFTEKFNQIEEAAADGKTPKININNNILKGKLKELNTPTSKNFFGWETSPEWYTRDAYSYTGKGSDFKVIDGGAKTAIQNWLKDTMKNYEVSLIEGKSGDNFSDYKIERKSETNNLNNVSTILKNIATFDVNVVHQALSTSFEAIMSGSRAFYLHAGYKPYFVNNQEDVKKYVCEKDIGPKIKYGPFVPHEVKMTFDLKNLDENGYPMSGKIEITTWNLLVAGYGVKFATPNET